MFELFLMRIFDFCLCGKEKSRTFAPDFREGKVTGKGNKYWKVV